MKRIEIYMTSTQAEGWLTRLQERKLTDADYLDIEQAIHKTFPKLLSLRGGVSFIEGIVTAAVLIVMGFFSVMVLLFFAGWL